MSRKVLVIGGMFFISLMAHAQELRIQWSPELRLSSLDNIGQALATLVVVRGEPKKVLLRKGGSLEKISGSYTWVGGSTKETDNCNDYLAATAAGFRAADNSVDDGPFVERCYALLYLEHVQPARISYFDGGGWSQGSLNMLPPIVMGVERELEEKAAEARARGMSWRAYDPSLKVELIKPPFLYLEDDFESYYIEILAKGDFNGDGTEDWAVTICGHSHMGSFHGCFPAVITRLGPHQVASFLTSLVPPYTLAARH
jgi:hypothetical protein